MTHTKTRQKYRNFQREPRVALSIADPANPYRFLEVRGTVEKIDDDDAEASFYQSLQRRYGRSYPIHGTVTQALESEGIKGEAAKIGAGAGVGAIIGGILGGAKGALLGVLIGGGGTIAATEGKDVKLPAGTVLRVRFEQPLVVR